jgi:hypothetical protein
MVLHGAESFDGTISQAPHSCNVVIMVKNECAEVSCGFHVSMAREVKDQGTLERPYILIQDSVSNETTIVGGILLRNMR